MVQQLGRARGLLESAAGIAVVTGVLYLLGVVHEQAYFGRFGIRALYLDAPASTYGFRSAPAIVTIIFAGYLVFLFRAIGAVVASVAHRGLRASFRAFIRPHPGEVDRKGQIVSFLFARVTFALLILSPWILLGASDMVLRLALDDVALWLAFLLAIVVVQLRTIRGVLPRHVPEPNRRPVEHVLLFGAVFRIALLAAQRSGEIG